MVVGHGLQSLVVHDTQQVGSGQEIADLFCVVQVQVSIASRIL